MENLYTLVQLVSFDALQTYIPPETKPKEWARWQQLYQALSTPSGPTDTELAQQLYGISRTASHPPYLKLKEDFEWASLRALLSVPHLGKTMDREEVEAFCWRVLALANGIRERKEVAELLLPLLQLAAAYDLVAAQLETAFMLHTYRIFLDYEQEQAEGNLDLVDQLAGLQRQVDACKIAYYEWQHALVEQQTDPAGLSSLSQARTAEIASIVESVANCDIQYFGGLFLMGAALQQADYAKAAEWGRQVDAYFEAHFPGELSARQQLHYGQLQAAIAQQDYAQGAHVLASLRALLEADKNQPDQQLALLEAELLLCLRTAQVAAALSLMAPIADLFDKGLAPQRYPQWWCYILQLRCLLQSAEEQAMEAALAQLGRWEKQLAKKVDEAALPDLARWNGLLLQTTIAIQDKNYALACQYLRLLQPNMPKRIRTGQTGQRLFLYYQLLETAAKSNFHAAATARHAQKIVSKLEQTRAAVDEEALEYELLNFQWLWAEVQKHLSTKAPKKAYWPQ